jgi:hypothetical protein
MAHTCVYEHVTKCGLFWIYLSMYTCIKMYVCMHVCVCVYRNGVQLTTNLLIFMSMYRPENYICTMQKPKDSKKKAQDERQSSNNIEAVVTENDSVRKEEEDPEGAIVRAQKEDIVKQQLEAQSSSSSKSRSRTLPRKCWSSRRRREILTFRGESCK